MKNYNVACYSQWLSEFNLYLILVIIGFASCTSPLYTPSKDNIPPTANIEELKKGRQLYVNKCGACHTLFLPVIFDHSQWIKAVDKMQTKAQINDQEKNLIVNYLSKAQK